jgi:predicted small secreted protein
LGFFYQFAANHLTFWKFVIVPFLGIQKPRFLFTLRANKKTFLAWEMRSYKADPKKKGGEVVRLKTIFSALFLTVLVSGTLVSIGCNTVHGVGQDIVRGGEKTQDAADAVKRRM